MYNRSIIFKLTCDNDMMSTPKTNQNKPMSKQAVSYIRFSSAIQERGISIKRQRDLVQDWLDTHPQYTLIEEYKDEAKSAFKGAHMQEGSALPRLIKDMEKGLYKPGTALLVEALDRLSREDLADAEDQLKALLRMGFEVVITSQNGRSITFEDWSDIGKRVEFMVYQKEAHHQSAEKSRRHRKNWADKRASGKIITRSCPAWLQANEDKSAFLPVEPHLTTVRRIVKMRLQGLSMAKIAMSLNDDLTPNFKGGTGRWNQSTIQELVNNPALHGLKVPSRNTIAEGVEDMPDYYVFINKAGKKEAAVTLADYQQCKKMVGKWAKGRTGSNTTANHVNIFRGVLVCAYCGATIIQTSVTPEKMGYYVCSMKRQGRCKDAKAIRRDMVEDTILNGLLYNTERLLSGTNIDKEELRQMEAEREAVKQKREMLTDLLLDGRIDREVYNQRYDGLGSQLAMLDYQIAAQKNTMNTDFPSDLVMNMNMQSLTDRVELQTIVRDVIKTIRLNGNTQTCDIEMTSGYTLNNYPLSYVIDGQNWIETLHVLGEREYTFTGSESRQPLHLTFKNAPEWVKLAIEKESYRQPLEA